MAVHCDTQPPAGSRGFGWPEIVWENPFRSYPLSDGSITIASELASIMRAVRENVEPEYGAANGRIDRQIDLAISESHAAGSAPVEIG